MICGLFVSWFGLSESDYILLRHELKEIREMTLIDFCWDYSVREDNVYDVCIELYLPFDSCCRLMRSFLCVKLGGFDCVLEFHETYD